MKKLAFCLSVAFAAQPGTAAIWLSGAARVIELRKRMQTPAGYMDGESASNPAARESALLASERERPST
jgi:hypothetical protein